MSDRIIDRREFLNATLLASGALLTGPLSPAELLARAAAQGDDWTGPGGVGDYATSNGNTLAVLTEGHAIRERTYEALPAGTIDTGETYDCVVVGGGISGLAVALIFERRARAGMTCLVLDNHPIFGGEAKRNEFNVDGRRLLAHQGSAFFFVPYPYSFTGRFYESLGLTQPRLTYQTWGDHARGSPDGSVRRQPGDRARVSGRRGRRVRTRAGRAVGVHDLRARHAAPAARSRGRADVCRRQQRIRAADRQGAAARGDRRPGLARRGLARRRELRGPRPCRLARAHSAAFDGRLGTARRPARPIGHADDRLHPRGTRVSREGAFGGHGPPSAPTSRPC